MTKNPIKEDLRNRGHVMTRFGLISITLLAASLASPQVRSGDPDAIASFGNLQSDIIHVWGCKDGIQAYSVEAGLCNIGDEALAGGAGLTSNLYRLSDDNKRFEQIGLSWIKYSSWSAGLVPCNACGVFANGCTQSTGLGVGCRDIYSAGQNGAQNSSLGPRSEINPWTGDHYGTTDCTNPDDLTSCRLQVPKADVVSGAQYFLELQAITNDDYESSAALRNNNVSYKPATFGACQACTCDGCGDPACRYQLTAGTGDCESNSDCTDTDACTIANCNDSDPCTSDYCSIAPEEEGTCAHTCTTTSCTACCIGYKEPAIKAWKKYDSSVVETDPIQKFSTRGSSSWPRRPGMWRDVCGSMSTPCIT